MIILCAGMNCVHVVFCQLKRPNRQNCPLLLNVVPPLSVPTLTPPLLNGCYRPQLLLPWPTRDSVTRQKIRVPKSALIFVEWPKRSPPTLRPFSGCSALLLLLLLGA